MYCDKLVTTDARQIAITAVDKGSPADGVLAVSDMLLGTGGKAFSFDPRTELGRAITAAETEAGGGKLALTRWRAGKSEEVVVKLPVMGSFSATAPFDCPKSQWAADFMTKSYSSWYYGYVMIFLAEYITATGDQSVLPGLQRLALETAKGRSAVGSWGHKFALPDGRLVGYGMMNASGLPLTIGLAMARDAGVKDPEVAKAIELSARLAGETGRPAARGAGPGGQRV